MKNFKWALIALNEYRMRTSSIREIRPYLPFLLIAGLGIYVGYIAPKIVSLLVNDLIAFFLSQAAVPMMQILLFMFFFVFITFPASYALKDVQTGQQEIFLSAPISPSSILLGEFLGELPLYGIVVVLITGFFTALLDPLKMTIFQKILIIVVFILIFTSALWIGTVITALLRTKLGTTAKGRDIGKGLSILIVLPALAIMYAIMSGRLLETLADPATSGIVKTLLGWLPSSWGADIFVSFASNPQNMSAVAGEILIRFGGLILFCGAVFWLGVRMADRAYNLETATFTVSRAKSDGILYKTIRRIGGSSFGILLATVFKVYTRRLQNISWLIYVVGLTALLSMFFIPPEDLLSTTLPFMFLSPLLAAVVASDITLRGKETLFIYRKTPQGENRFIKAMVFKGWVVAIPLTALMMITRGVFNPEFMNGSLFVPAGVVAGIAAADIAFASGLFLLIPAYSEKGGEFVVNMMIIVWISMGLLGLSFLLFEERIIEFAALIMLHWAVGLAVLYLGRMRLKSIE